MRFLGYKCVCVCESTACRYLGGQQSGQVDFRDHLAPSVPFPLVRVVVVLDQVPQFGAALEVGGDHWGPGAQAVWTAGRPQHALWNEVQEQTRRRVE